MSSGEKRELLLRLTDIINSECVKDENCGLGGRLLGAAERQEAEWVATLGWLEELSNIEKEAEQAHVATVS